MKRGPNLAEEACDALAGYETLKLGLRRGFAQREGGEGGQAVPSRGGSWSRGREPAGCGLHGAGVPRVGGAARGPGRMESRGGEGGGSHMTLGMGAGPLQHVLGLEDIKRIGRPQKRSCE